MKSKLEELLSLADIRINGSRPFDLVVHDERFYARVISQGSLGLGESYMDGWWDCESIDELVSRIMKSQINKKISPVVAFELGLKAVVFNLQNKSRAFEIGEHHYDMGNDLYETMLDKRMTYTCGYWKDATTLDDAQVAKLDLVCRKINLRRDMTVLDIGCGWGSFMIYAAQNYGAKATGLTVSKEQVEFGKQRAAELPVEYQLKDYRDVAGTYDHVVSLGMFEHVGNKNYRTFMEVASRSLKDGGLFLLHTIGGNESKGGYDPWLDKYIFPNSRIPSIAQISAAAEGLFVMEDWHNFGADYEKTLLAWFDNFNRGWERLKPKYGEGADRFYRMWKFYLLSCAGLFRARDMQLWQIVLSKQGVPGGYQSIR